MYNQINVMYMSFINTEAIQNKIQSHKRFTIILFHFILSERRKKKKKKGN